MLVRVGKFVFPTYFIIMDFSVDIETPIVFGKPFLYLARTLINMERRELTMRVNGKQVVLNVLNALKYLGEGVGGELLCS